MPQTKGNYSQTKGNYLQTRGLEHQIAINQNVHKGVGGWLAEGVSHWLQCPSTSAATQPFP